METITNAESLSARIFYLEQQREIEKEAIATEAREFIESLKPVNMLKSFLRSVRESPDLKSDIMHGAIGLGTGFLTNKLLLGKMHGPLKKVLGMLVQVGITKAAVAYPETIKSKGLSILANFLQSMKIKSSDNSAEHAHHTETI